VADRAGRSTHVYEVRPCKDKRGADLISDVLPFGRLLYGEPNAVANAIGYAQFYSRRAICGYCTYQPAETQPQLQPALLSLSAIISQYFTNPTV